MSIFAKIWRLVYGTKVQSNVDMRKQFYNYQMQELGKGNIKAFLNLEIAVPKNNKPNKSVSHATVEQITAMFMDFVSSQSRTRKLELADNLVMIGCMVLNDGLGGKSERILSAKPKKAKLQSSIVFKKSEKS